MSDASSAPNVCAVLSLGDAFAALRPAPAPPFATLFRHGTLAVELYAPRGRDDQTPHTRDEAYVVARGTATFVGHGGVRSSVRAGDFVFVPAGAEHRFVDLSDDFATWVLFYGAEGGEGPHDDVAVNPLGPRTAA